MIPLNLEQRLGRKTWRFLLLKNNSTAVGLIILAVLLGLLQNFIAEGMSGYLKLLATSTTSAEVAVAGIVSFVAIILLIIGIIMFLYGLVVSNLHYKNYTFTLEDFGLKLRKGIFSIKEISIPYRQIQNVDVTKSLTYQFFGVSRLVIITAGQEDDKAGDETDSVFDPIDADIAEEIREMLQKKIGVQAVESEKAAVRAPVERVNK